jgi:hypothetical protein
VTHGENLHILIFGENASEAESLAILSFNHGHAQLQAPVSAAGKPGTDLYTDIPDNAICCGTGPSPDFASETV